VDTVKIVYYRWNAMLGTDQSTLKIRKPVSLPFPLSVEWEKKQASTYVFENTGVIRYRRIKPDGFS